eukprot:gene6162-7675_t
MTSPIWTRPSVLGRAAPLRSSHSSALLSNSHIALFGGWDGNNVLNDLVLFKLDNPLTWVFPEVYGSKPSKRAGHSATVLPDGMSFLIFGGSDGERYLSDVHLFNAVTMEWKEIHTTGIKPQPRSRHSATLINKHIYIYGGNDNHTTFNSLYILDIETMKWSIPNCSGDTPPPPLWGHSSTLFQDKIYFYGGCNGQDPLNTFSIFDISNQSWNLNITVTSIGPAPLPRVTHSLSLYNGNFILLGGGCGTNEKILNDCFIFNPETMVWKHFSGDNPPPQRCSHTCEVFNGKIYMFGGSDGQRYFKDIYILDTEKVLLKLENAPKKRIRLRPKPNQLINLNNVDDNNNSTTSTTTITTTTPIASTTPTNPSILVTTTTTNNNISNNSTTTISKSAPVPTTTTTTTSNNTTTKIQLNNNHNIDPKYKSIIEWLKSINLSKYENHFISNGITMDNLDYLTEKHLEEDLKIPTLGARLRVLNTIEQQKPKKPKEKDEKELLLESIASLKSIAETLNSLNNNIQQLSTTTTNNNNNNSNHNNNIHNLNNSSNNSPTLSAFNSCNGRSRRNSHV